LQLPSGYVVMPLQYLFGRLKNFLQSGFVPYKVPPLIPRRAGGLSAEIASIPTFDLKSDSLLVSAGLLTDQFANGL